MNDILRTSYEQLFNVIEELFKKVWSYTRAEIYCHSINRKIDHTIG